MDEIDLVLPTMAHEEEALAYRQEHFDNGEFILHGSALFDKTKCYDEWLYMVVRNRKEETKNPGWVVDTNFFAVRKQDGKLVGMIDVRHSLNDMLASIGGHIGYGVRPSERQKGYATQMLQKALAFSRDLGLTRVLLVCNKSNDASRKTILKCGGVLQDEYVHTDGRVLERYWIDIM